jgi:hypothetical protein
MNMLELEKTTTEESPAAEPAISIKSSAPHDCATQSIAGSMISTLKQLAAQGAAITMAIALGWYAGAQSFSPATDNAAEPEWVRSATAIINKTQQDVFLAADDVRRVKETMASLSHSLANERGSSDAKEDVIINTLEGLTRATETIVARLEQHNASLEGRQRELPNEAPTTREPLPAASSASHDPSLAEHSRMATALAVLGGPAVEPKPAPRNLARLTGWVLRDVYNGNAVIETPQRILHEVGPGKTLPGVGRIEAVERKGKSWVVLTSKGVIAHDGTP